MDELEQSVKRSQMALAVIERALNDPTGWSIVGDGRVTEAQVITSEEGVTFWSVFQEWGDADEVGIYHCGELLWVSHIHPPETGAFEVEVTLLLAQHVAA